MLQAALTEVLHESQAPEFFSKKTFSALEQQGNDNLRVLLEDILISSDTHWKADTLKLIDMIWKDGIDSQPTVNIDHLKSLATIQGTRLTLYHGDITQLTSSDSNLAIVNAANDQGLGCFVPHHRCIDNVIHRRAGPRLRMECQALMTKRGSSLRTGTPPIVTSSYHLPSSKIIHITGPQVKRRGIATKEERRQLIETYKMALDAAAAQTPGIQQAIAIPCISTGIFGFPQDEAAEIALTTTKQWLEENPHKLQHVVFNVFADSDLEIYEKAISDFDFDDTTTEDVPRMMDIEDTELLDRQDTVDLAKIWIESSDSILICAGAGMSVKEGEMVYTNPEDFAKAYPFFIKWGYRTAYETMGLEGDARVPRNAKWAFYAKHMNNMRWDLAPNDGYQDLLKLIGKKDYFVLTSNVDACFERSGFDTERIYTPQGEWTYVQCTKPCRHDSVYESRPYLDKILPHIDENGFIPEELVPKCPRCGSDMFGNVRGGDWFLHEKYQAKNQALQEWMEDQIRLGKKVTIIEIGAGFNTPTVTRFPMEAFARDLGPNFGRLIRINPSDAEIPEDLNAIGLAEGWEVLRDILDSTVSSQNNMKAREFKNKQNMMEAGLVAPNQVVNQYKRFLGHFDWRQFLTELGDSRRER